MNKSLTKIRNFFSGLKLVNNNKFQEQVAETANRELKILQERKLFGVDLEKMANDFSLEQRSPRGVKIEVTNNAVKDTLISNGWFTSTEIQVVENKYKTPKEIKRAIENFYTGNFYSHSRELDPAQIRIAQDACYARMKTDPIFSGAINHLINYIVGSGVQVTSPINNINDYLKDFIKTTNKLHNNKLENEIVLRHFVEGEQFVLLSFNPMDNEPTLTYVETYQVIGWEFHPKIRNLVLAYLIDDGAGNTIWVKDYRYDEISKSKNKDITAKSAVELEFKNNKYIIHLKDNPYPEFRGRPPGLPALRFLKYAEDFLYDRIVLNHERSRVVWIRTILGRAASNLANYLAAPPGGVMLNQTEDIKYDIAKAEINAGDVKEDYLSILYMVASAFLMPIHILNMRADEQVYSSVLSAKAPFTKAIEKWQSNFQNYMTTIFEFIILQKVISGKFKTKYKFDYYDVENDKIIKKDIDTNKLPIYIVFPNPIDERLSERTTHENFLVKNKIVSMRTIRERNGFNHFEETRRIEQEKEEYKEIMTLTRGRADDNLNPDDSTSKKATSNVGQPK